MTLLNSHRRIGVKKTRKLCRRARKSSQAHQSIIVLNNDVSAISPSRMCCPFGICDVGMLGDWRIEVNALEAALMRALAGQL